MTKINYVVGDATNPTFGQEGHKIIAHVCNDIGKWGAGFVLAISKRWYSPREAYIIWSNSKSETFAIGNTQFVEVKNINGEKTIVANMIAQSGTINKYNPQPLNYDALRATLTTIGLYAQVSGASVHLPKMIGCGLAGGKFEIVEQIINDTLIRMGVEVYVYEYRG